MVQYDPFAILFAPAAFSLRPMASSDHPSPAEAQAHNATDPTSAPIHPQLRRLSSTQPLPHHYCAKCHMRRPSQEFHPAKHHRDSSPTDETWDGFCPDISMPNDLIAHRSASQHRNHKRRHSGLCPDGVFMLEGAAAPSSPALQMTATSPPLSRHTSQQSQHQCSCETVIPVDDLEARYGLVEEPEQIQPKRMSLDKEAAAQVAEIMHAELLADMDARA